LLAALPAVPGAHQYIHLEFDRKRGQLLLDRPGAANSEAQRLWDARVAHYQGERKRPVAVTRADRPYIAAEWTRFSAAAAKGRAGAAEVLNSGCNVPAFES